MAEPRTVQQETMGEVTLYDRGLTLINPFFGEAERFEKQFKNLMDMPDKIKDTLKVIMVDDHGKVPVHEMLTPSKVKRIDFDLSVFRIKDNLRYSTPCALNLGIMCASTPWVLIMDSDCLFDPEEMDKVLSLGVKHDWQYKFDRKRVTNNEHKRKNTRFLPCTNLMEKENVIRVMGFDEDFTGEWSGGYGFFDNQFDNKWVADGFRLGKIQWIHATEYMEDQVGPCVVRDSGTHHTINKKIMYAKDKGENPRRDNMLNFAWERTFRHRRDRG
jgi:hypothetical protein